MNRRGFLAALGAGVASLALPLDAAPDGYLRDPDGARRVWPGRQRTYSFAKAESGLWMPEGGRLVANAEYIIGGGWGSALSIGPIVAAYAMAR